MEVQKQFYFCLGVWKEDFIEVKVLELNRESQ